MQDNMLTVCAKLFSGKRIIVDNPNQNSFNDSYKEFKERRGFTGESKLVFKELSNGKTMIYNSY